MSNRKPKQTSKEENKNQAAINKKPSLVIQYIPLISAVIAALGFITVAIINRSTVYVPIKFTQTAEIQLTSIAVITQEYVSQITNAPTVAPTRALTDTPVPTVTIQPVLIFYAMANEAGVYDRKDQSIKPFQTLPRGTYVKVLDTSDSTWLYVTYIKDRTEITGFVLREQFILDFVPMETFTPTP